ncbi:MAG: 3'(2'),5'-bisphosphate nucleotidase CysQ [Bryobacteraceae bacterium]|nr:3'(2'),5'-bisphosphate nucleotidase CysQ [Bryobacteraceae bacterium]
MLSAETLDINELIRICHEAGAAVMDVYEKDFQVQSKEDASPLTQADLCSHTIITGRLGELYPETPVLSEESATAVAYEIRRHWTRCWLVDPLDGTKEFIKKNGQFTINIALIEDARPAAGVVYAPALDLLYYGIEGQGAYKIAGGAEARRLPIPSARRSNALVIVGSLSHSTPALEEFVARERDKHDNVEFIPMGSSLKICLVAEGTADLYPRLGPTMEWDTAAAHAVANAAGRKLFRYGRQEELTYNKPDLHNDWFVAQPDPARSLDQDRACV